MSPKWFVYLLMLWLGCALLGGIMEMAFLGNGTGHEITVLYTILNPQMTKFLGVITTPVPNGDWWNSWWHLFTFDFIYFKTGVWVLVGWMFRLLPMSVLGSIIIILVGRMPVPGG